MGQKEVLGFIKANDLIGSIPKEYLEQLENDFKNGRLSLIYLIDEKLKEREKVNENVRKKGIYFKENGKDVLEISNTLKYYNKLTALRKLACIK